MSENSETRKINPATATGKLVIFNEAKEEFLGRVEDKGATNVLWWTTSPWEAKTYKSMDDAMTEAARIAKSKGHTLDICELHQEGKNLALAPKLFVEPTNKD